MVPKVPTTESRMETVGSIILLESVNNLDMESDTGTDDSIIVLESANNLDMESDAGTDGSVIVLVNAVVVSNCCKSPKNCLSNILMGIPILNV